MEIYGKDLSKKWELVRFEIPNGVGSFREMVKVSFKFVCVEEWFGVYAMVDTVYINQKKLFSIIRFSIINLKGPKIALIELFLTFNANFEKFLPRRKIKV